MEVVIPTIVENGTAYLDWRPISRDQMMEEHMRAITIAVSYRNEMTPDTGNDVDS
jgi:hypothetical protein